jgi:hypothetical protein
MPVLKLTTALSMVCMLVAGCTDDGPGPAVPSSNGPSTTDIRGQIVDRVNEYRATVGLGPLEHWEEKDACTGEQACSDAESGQAHGAFLACGERAQNECPNYRSTDGILATCLPSMWAEGPGGGHYENMTSTAYSQMSVGLCTGSSGRIWCVMNFYR